VNEKTVALSSDQVVTFGKEIIIVKDDAVSSFLENVDELNIHKELDEMVSDVHSSVVLEEDEKADDEIKALKEKQIELLKGKRLQSSIYDDKGNMLLNAGTILARSDIEMAQEAGPGIIVNLSMSVEE
ncbi:MAG: photosystem reaction center subunit H, partial [Bacillota bacterium]|nr:photosystem reaction center subunit H [Bacillota bacterium]